MNARSRWLLLAVGLLLLAGGVGLAVLGVRFLLQRQELAHWEYQPPVVRIAEPLIGSEAPVGSYLPAVALITFPPQSPAQTVEWYLDGILVESHSLQPAAGAARAYDPYDLLVAAEGTHVLVVRAVDGRGMAGLSQPLVFQGVAGGEAFYAVTVNEGETLEDIASGYGSDAAALAAVNPGLELAPAPGTIVKVPIPPEDEPPAPLPAPAGSASGVTLPADSPMLNVSESPSRILSLLAASPPLAPTNLQGEVKNCRVRLIWEDNAKDETGYGVWMAAGGAPLTRLATLQPALSSVAWFEFQAPGPGSFLFWIEAVNAVGQRGSNIIPLDVDPGCPLGAPTHLHVEILEVSTTAPVERAYCYVSFENAPEARLPAQESGFITVQGGQGDLTSWPRTFALPIPEDGTLDLSGECWGWAGENLTPLGTYGTSLVREAWDGAPRRAQAGAFEISLAVRYESPTGTKITFAERSPGLPSGSFPGFLEETLPIDPTVPIPAITGMIETADHPLTARCNPRCQRLFWTWAGDETKIRGFAVYLNGQLYAAVFPYPSMRSVIVQPPISACGGTSRWQVAAVTASAMSPLSAEYVLPGPHPHTANPAFVAGTCTIYVKVKFEVLDLEWTHEGYGSGGPGDCDTLDALYYIHVDERGAATGGSYLYATRKFYSGEFPRAMKCGVHGYQDLFDRVNPALVSRWAPVPGTVPIEHGAWPFSEIILAGDLLRPDQSIILLVGAHFFDHDYTSADDWIAKYGTEYVADNFQAAIDYFGCGKTFIDDDEMDSGKSRLQYTITIYPNACERKPEGLP
jgi:hypothetical protein